MRVDEQEIVSISREVWEAQLGLTVRPAETDPSIEEKALSSCITVSGPWKGAILVECPESVARHAAAMLYSADGDGASEEEIQDALNDLAQMVGEKMLGMLPQESKLSRPALILDVQQSEPLARMQGLSEIKLDCEGRPMRISLFETELAGTEKN